MQKENLTEEGKKTNLDEFDDDSRDGESNYEDELDDLEDQINACRENEKRKSRENETESKEDHDDEDESYVDFSDNDLDDDNVDIGE